MPLPKPDKQVRINNELYSSLAAVAGIQRRTIKGLCELLLERGLRDEQNKIDLYTEEND
jgi:hypothetical protein|tara:strand:- start:1204 stop:1380 length:177 start_codon:yes stop_codon:yes gene_type:complete